MAPLYTVAPTAPMDNYKQKLRASVMAHPVRWGVALGLLVLLTVICIVSRYRASAAEGMKVMPARRTKHEMIAAQNAAAIAKSKFMGFRWPRREGLDPSGEIDPAVDLSTAGVNPGPCAAGMTPVTYVNPDGKTMTRCVSSGPSVIADPTAILAACGMTWDPAATAEAQALATVGSFQHNSWGERKLQSAIDAAYDSNVGLTDDQLAQAMAGGAP